MCVVFLVVCILVASSLVASFSCEPQAHQEFSNVLQRASLDFIFSTNTDWNLDENLTPNIFAIEGGFGPVFGNTLFFFFKNYSCSRLFFLSGKTMNMSSFSIHSLFCWETLEIFFFSVFFEKGQF